MRALFMAVCLSIMTICSYFAMTSEARAGDCVPTAIDACIRNVPGENFHGTDQRLPDYQVEVCLPDDIQQLITFPDDNYGPNGGYGWTVRIVHFRQDGSFWASEIVATLENQPCRVQNVRHGSRIATLITCPTNIWTGGPGYVGWLMTQPVTGSGRYELYRVDWIYIPPDLTGQFLALAQQYLGS